uniref:Beta-galactosidase n=1 Tax=Zea mays TaxID=4577 RepID=A0A804N4B8_MAIZE
MSRSSDDRKNSPDVDDCDLLIHFYVDAHGDICKDHNKKAQGCQPFRVTRRAHHSSQNCCGNLFLSRLPFGLLENEYRHLEAAFKDDGTKYINWAAKMTISTNIGIPWIMSKQTKAPGDVGWKQVWLVYSQGWWPNAFSLAICLCHMSQISQAKKKTAARWLILVFPLSLATSGILCGLKIEWVQACYRR